ncbi:5-(carboxyamino)imidazole ribonucleotide synthase [Derxia gummosa]|uniref:5-(Carboxyamino)imidazole ribonucleotide synthase n=1 Tax=Derxia gummosa DSM 723 TaxID=1121388 RepID=A0AC36K9Y0_9BURK
MTAVPSSQLPLPILPGAWLGMLGGGQLGRMFCFEAQAMGYRVLVLDPDAHSPAGAVADRHLRAAYDDAAALDEMARVCRAVTTEFENVPAPTLARLARDCLVAPGASAVAIAQDRIAEKRFIQTAGQRVAPHAVIESDADLDDAVIAPLLPGVLKVARLGYDGKGQVRVSTPAQARAAFIEMGRVPCVLEQFLDLDFEVSVVCARGHDGRTASFPVVENVHRAGILAVTTAPSPRADASQVAAAREAALTIADMLGYVGVLCVEFFVLRDGSLVVNEMAPRPHNSGHYSIEACVVSQFEQQVRALAGLPLSSGHQHSPAVMLNLLGDVWFDEEGQLRAPRWTEVLAIEGAKLHLYGKADPRRGRKMGHITCVGPTVEAARNAAIRAAEVLGLPRPA